MAKNVLDRFHKDTDRRLPENEVLTKAKEAEGEEEGKAEEEGDGEKEDGVVEALAPGRWVNLSMPPLLLLPMVGFYRWGIALGAATMR